MGSEIRSDRDDELTALRREAEHLRLQVTSNRRIGMAMGILMALEKITEDQAWDRLRQSSQHLNHKLREIADEVIRTGQLAAPDRVRPPATAPLPALTHMEPLAEPDVDHHLSTALDPGDRRVITAVTRGPARGHRLLCGGCSTVLGWDRCLADEPSPLIRCHACGALNDLSHSVRDIAPPG